MSPKQVSTITDHQSENDDAAPPESPRRGRPPFPRALVLAAADRLFAAADVPGSVSMDAIAAEAGVGKGTLFRAFGNRTQLINAVFEARVAPIRAAVDGGDAPLGPSADPVTRTVAILNTLLALKVENAYLGREMEFGGTDLLELDYYRWLHAIVREQITAATGEADPRALAFSAQALISTLRADLHERLLADGATVADLQQAQARLIRQVLSRAG